jgi:adenylosuccinate synthase
LINPNCIALIGNGVVVHLPSFFEEKAKLEAKGMYRNINFVKKELEKRKRGKPE